MVLESMAGLGLDGRERRKKSVKRRREVEQSRRRDLAETSFGDLSLFHAFAMKDFGLSLLSGQRSRSDLR